jgi:uncharacterized RDD family membrane protein YckC
MPTQRYAGLWVRVAAFAFDYIPIAGYLVLVVALGGALNAQLPEVADQVFSQSPHRA